MPTRLNTTDFAILGLLARRPWSAYDMTQYMRTSNVRAVWPRAESRIYESPKKLASLGFATVVSVEQGKRSRAIYTITDEGRQALEAWLAEPGKNFSFEYEALLKLTLSDIANVEQEHSQLDYLAEQGEQDWEQLSGWFRLFAQSEDRDMSADRKAQNLLVNTFIKELLEARVRWSDFAQDFEQAYEACTNEDEKNRLVQEYYQRLTPK